MKKEFLGAMLMLGAGLASSTDALAAGQTGKAAPIAATAVAKGATPAERSAAIRTFVRRWAGYVESTYGVEPKAWAMRMVPVFVHGDADNIQAALKRNTFEGAMAALDGRGRRISDAQVVDRLAKLPPLPTARKAASVAAKFGDLSQDLAFTPIQPCRILDTRVAGGPIAAGGSRSFAGINESSFTSQGGSATNCGTLGLSAAALVLNVTAVAPSIAGYATVYPYGTTQPVAASVNYTAGAIVNNTVLAQIPNPLAAFDFTIYSYAASNYVVDIVGYFAPPVATELQCTSTSVSQSVAANAIFDIAIPACPANYTMTGAGCRTPGFADADWGINGYSPVGTFCSGKNKTAGSITVEGGARCCRVPGR